MFFGASQIIGAVMFALYPFYRWQVAGNRWFLLFGSLGIPLALFVLWFVVTNRDGRRPPPAVAAVPSRAFGVG